MKKEIKVLGNELVITFSPEDQRLVGLAKDDIIDFTINDIQTKEPLK